MLWPARFKNSECCPPKINFSLRRLLLLPVVVSACFKLSSEFGSDAVIPVFVSAAAACGIVLLVDRSNVIFVIASFVGGLIGLAAWPWFAPTIRDGNYMLDVVHPAKFRGVVIGWLVAVCAVRGVAALLSWMHRGRLRRASGTTDQ